MNLNGRVGERNSSRGSTERWIPYERFQNSMPSCIETLVAQCSFDFHTPFSIGSSRSRWSWSLASMGNGTRGGGKAERDAKSRRRDGIGPPTPRASGPASKYEHAVSFLGP